MLYPLFAMVVLTLVVGIITVRARFQSVRSRQLSPRYFKDMQLKNGMEIPERVQITSRCYNNQFEVPILFYTAGVCAIALGLETWLTVLTAWVFVVSRMVHAWIHLTYNHLLHRMRVYWFGLLTVLALWLELVVARLL